MNADKFKCAGGMDELTFLSAFISVHLRLILRLFASPPDIIRHRGLSLLCRDRSAFRASVRSSPKVVATRWAKTSRWSSVEKAPADKREQDYRYRPDGSHNGLVAVRSEHSRIAKLRSPKPERYKNERGYLQPPPDDGSQFCHPVNPTTAAPLRDTKPSAAFAHLGGCWIPDARPLRISNSAPDRWLDYMSLLQVAVQAH